jgi:thiamine-phosphate pyrophosphorylase
MSDTPLAALVGSATSAGVDVIQLRARHLEGAALTHLARTAIRAAAGTQARVVVNDRLDVAVAAGASGVHLRGDSFPAGRARSVTPPGFLIGRSVHSVEEAVSVDAAGECDYLLFGSVFPSTSKPPDHRPAGLAALRRVCECVRTPVLAIGGITVATAGLVRDAGAAGVAAISLFRDCDDLPQTVGALKLAFGR